jgi:hypothetical protein
MPREEPFVLSRFGTFTAVRLFPRINLVAWHKKREEANFLPFPEKY